MNMQLRNVLIIVVLGTVLGSALADIQWENVNLDDVTAFNIYCGYRITTKELGENTMINGTIINPNAIMFHLGNIYAPGYVQATDKHNLCALPINESSNTYPQTPVCLPAKENGVLSIEMLCL